MAAIAREWTRLVRIDQQLMSASLGIFDAEAFRKAVQRVRHGEEVPIVPLMRSLSVERWLRSINHRAALISAPRIDNRRPTTIETGNSVQRWDRTERDSARLG